MEEKLKEVLVRIEYLEKLINSLQQWVILTWAILAVIVAVLSVTITILVKRWVDKKVEDQLDIKLKEIKENIREETMKDLKGYLAKNRQVKWAKGISVIDEKQRSINITGIDINKENLALVPLKCEIFLEPPGGKKYFTEAYNYNLSNDGVLSIQIDNYMQVVRSALYWEIIWIEILKD